MPVKVIVRAGADLGVAAVLGLAAMIGSAIAGGSAALSNVPAAVPAAWENLSLLSVTALFAAGVMSGMLARSSLARFVGVGCLAAYPALAVVEMVTDPVSHNLWPIEFGLYAAVSLVPLSGSMSVHYAKSRWLRRPRR